MQRGREAELTVCGEAFEYLEILLDFSGAQVHLCWT